MKDPLPEKAQKSFDLLLNAFIPPTLQILQKDKFLAPIAMNTDEDGKPAFIGFQPENDSDAVDTAKHLQAFRKLLDREYKNSETVLLAYDVKISNNPDFRDAIAMELKHSSGARVQLILPYKFSGLRKKLTTGEILRIGE